MEKLFTYQVKISLCCLIIKRCMYGKTLQEVAQWASSKYSPEYVKGSVKEIKPLSQDEFEQKFCPGLRKELRNEIANFDFEGQVESLDIFDDMEMELLKIIKKHFDGWLRIETNNPVETIHYPNVLEKWIERYFPEKRLSWSIFEHSANVHALDSMEEIKERLLDHIMKLFVKNKLETKINLEVKTFKPETKNK